MRSKDEILDQMIEVMPFGFAQSNRAYALIAMDVWAKQENATLKAQRDELLKEIREIRMQATRYRRATDDQDVLMVDLEIIASMCEKAIQHCK